MLDLLLARFEQHEARLVQAIDGQDVAAINGIDRQLRLVWQEILAYEPADDTEERRLFIFLLDSILSEIGARDGHLMRVREKVLDLYRKRT
ncbi:MAG: hypothetical protein R3D65_09010 [Zhengella sp.]|uniref:hypothetical protein n=1 Tax=Zhengella sp. TaxID=2282762 RepID=UPI001E0AE17C|nr:hypothetical protein [Notoacmeibacter sp.]MCC0025504.1 hypothetical protein [Brucellaceae bacterium]